MKAGAVGAQPTRAEREGSPLAEYFQKGVAAQQRDSDAQQTWQWLKTQAARLFDQ
jgi:hypothetical protein